MHPLNILTQLKYFFYESRVSCGKENKRHIRGYSPNLFQPSFCCITACNLSCAFFLCKDTKNIFHSLYFHLSTFEKGQCLTASTSQSNKELHLSTFNANTDTIERSLIYTHESIYMHPPGLNLENIIIYLRHEQPLAQLNFKT